MTVLKKFSFSGQLFRNTFTQTQKLYIIQLVMINSSIFSLLKHSMLTFWPFEEIWDILAILNENNFERGPSKDHPNYWPCYCTVHVYVVIQSGDVCCLLEWKQICAGFLSFVIYVLPWEIQLSRGEDWDSSNRFNPTTSLCLSQAGTWISNVNMPLSFFVFSELRCDKFGLNFSLVHRRLKC